MRMIASKYAERYLQIGKDPLSQINYDEELHSYIPILVLLKDGLSHVYYQYDLNYVLENITCPTEIKESSNRKILLILDALDEIHSSLDLSSLLNVIVPDFLKKYPNIKIILTTRLKAGLPKKFLNIKIDDRDNKYIRLLPFSQEQVNEFFEKYFTDEQQVQLFEKYGINKLTSDYIFSSLGLDINRKENNSDFEITKPSFYMDDFTAFF